MDSQLRLLTDDGTLANAAETVYATACELGLLKHHRITYTAITDEERQHRIQVLEGQKGAAEAVLAPHCPPARSVTVKDDVAEWELYRNPQTGRISSTPVHPIEADDAADLEDWNP